jgi:hypothetical protein
MYHNHGNEPFDPSTLEDMPPAPEPPQPDGLDDSFMEPITDEQLVDILQQHLILGGEPMSCTPSQSSLHGAISVGSPRIDFDRTELEGVATPFHLPGTAVTNDIYKMANELVQRSLLVRSKSSTDLLEQRRQELQSDPALRNINKPGGFRRHFVQQQERHTPSVSEDGSSLRRYSSLMATDLDASDPINSSGTPYKKTRHFLEFLAVSHIGMFDNFAGEDL